MASESEKIVLSVIVEAIVSLAIGLLTSYLLEAVLVLVAILFFTLWLFQRHEISILRSENERLRTVQNQPQSKDNQDTWITIVNTTIVLNKKQAIDLRQLEKGAHLLIQLNGDRRFKSFMQRTALGSKAPYCLVGPESKSWETEWDVFEEGQYKLIVEPSGQSAFNVCIIVKQRKQAITRIVVEQKSKALFYVAVRSLECNILPLDRSPRN